MIFFSLRSIAPAIRMHRVRRSIGSWPNTFRMIACYTSESVARFPFNRFVESSLEGGLPTVASCQLQTPFERLDARIENHARLDQFRRRQFHGILMDQVIGIHRADDKLGKPVAPPPSKTAGHRVGSEIKKKNLAAAIPEPIAWPGKRPRIPSQLSFLRRSSRSATRSAAASLFPAFALSSCTFASSSAA